MSAPKGGKGKGDQEKQTGLLCPRLWRELKWASHSAHLFLEDAAGSLILKLLQNIISVSSLSQGFLPCSLTACEGS